MSDDAIRATNDDATSCKKSGVDHGYWQDPYIQFFCRSSDRKAPEINRGYFARIAGVQSLLQQFIKTTEGNCQVINFGAGFDTTFWNLHDQNLAPRRFIELDFKDVTSRKCYYIKRRKELLAKISSPEGEVRHDGQSIHGDLYHLAPCDLRHIDQLRDTLQACECDASLPTVCIAECVLVYMGNQHSTNLLQFLASHFSSVLFINYEQVRMNDRFGAVMVQNLQSRSCALAGIEHCASLDTQQQRFLSTGWHGAKALDMNAVYASLPPAEVTRIEKLEFLDETEMLRQLFDHYCICCAYKDEGGKFGLNSISLTKEPT